MAICPNCNRYTLNFRERLLLSARVPRACPKCGKLFVNHVGADLLWMVTFAAAGAILAAVQEKPTLSSLAVVVLLVAPTRAFFARPIPYVRPPDRRSETDGGFVGTGDFPALIAALKASGKNGSFWVVLIPGTEKTDGSPANLQFSIEDNHLGMDWVLIARSNLDLKDRFLALASVEGLEPKEIKRNGVKYIRVTGDRDWSNIGKRILEQMFKQDQLTGMQLIITGFQWKSI